MKAKLVPVYFREGKTDRFEKQVKNLKNILSGDAELLAPVALGERVPECDGVVFPEILGEAYRKAGEFEKIGRPILIITSEFGTVSMWDWEIINFLGGKGIKTIAPYNLDQAKLFCRMLAVKKQMTQSRFLIFQDNPGEGFQPEIFKSFYWWEDQCTDRIKNKFGVTVERRSLKALGEKAALFSDSDARAEWAKWDYPVSGGFQEIMAINAVKLYLALREEIDSDSIVGMGTNCLNESHYCQSTPCLAWDRLLEEKGIIWACEGDTVTLATEYMVYKSLERPFLMTNIYPFLMGKAATKHEKIPGFPEFLPDPEDHVLLAHCGYFGLLPRRFSTDWRLSEKVLGIVNENSHMFDARMKTGDVTLTKLDAAMGKLMSVKADLKGYVQYDNSSDCRNGGIIKVADGRVFMDRVFSHHVILVEGDVSHELDSLARIMELEVDRF